MRNGQAVRTPLELRPGKAKRLRDNSTVCIVSSGIRGQSKGEWLDGTATFTTLEKLKHTLKHRNKSMGSRQGYLACFLVLKVT